MRAVLKIVGLVALALISFGAGTITAAFFHFGSPIVTVSLENAATQRITSVHLKHEHGSLSVSNIGPGQSRIARFYAPGESSYEIQVDFANGKTVFGGAGYVEAGYKVTEVITDTEIRSDIQHFNYADRRVR